MRSTLTLLIAMVLLGLATATRAQTSQAATMQDIEWNGRTYRVLEQAVGDPPSGGYPLVVLLDGNQTFDLARRHALEDGRPRLLVGIGYPEQQRREIVARRYFDLTPETPPELLPGLEARDKPRTGGQDEFVSLIVGKVLPDITGRHRIDPKRSTLFGHSLSGLLALHVLFEDAWPFSHIIAADPSIWWKNGAILAQMEAYARAPKAETRQVWIITSGKRAERAGTSSAASAQMAKLRSGPGGREVADRLSRIGGLNVRYQHMPEETHGSMVEPSIRMLLTTDWAMGEGR